MPARRSGAHRVVSESQISPMDISARARATRATITMRIWLQQVSAEDASRSRTHDIVPGFQLSVYEARRRQDCFHCDLLPMKMPTRVEGRYSN